MGLGKVAVALEYWALPRDSRTAVITIWGLILIFSICIGEVLHSFLRYISQAIQENVSSLVATGSACDTIIWRHTEQIFYMSVSLAVVYRIVFVVEQNRGHLLLGRDVCASPSLGLGLASIRSLQSWRAQWPQSPGVQNPSWGQMWDVVLYFLRNAIALFWIYQCKFVTSAPYGEIQLWWKRDSLHPRTSPFGWLSNSHLCKYTTMN